MIKTKVLLVDEDDLMSEALGRILTRNGFDIVCCTYADFIRVTTNSFSPDIVIIESDIIHNELLRLIEVLKPNAPRLKILVISGEDNEVEALKAGADDWMKKPYKLPVLLTRLEVLQRNSV